MPFTSMHVEAMRGAVFVHDTARSVKVAKAPGDWTSTVPSVTLRRVARKRAPNDARTEQRRTERSVTSASESNTQSPCATPRPSTATRDTARTESLSA
jgi:hypothetical protein